MKPRTVFIVGAGFSTEFGYPTARDLLHRVWRRLPEKAKEPLKSIVRFHHPTWDGRSGTVPAIEELLTELSANEDLLPEVRANGPFRVSHLRRAREMLLLEIARWFHEIHAAAGGREVLRRAVYRIRAANAAIISFNWDYELDRVLFDHPTPHGYGLTGPIPSRVVLLKPHGSLNWYPEAGTHIREELRQRLWRGPEPLYCFLRWRAPRSPQRRYVPFIVPPTHTKTFTHPMLRRIWRRCVDVLSVASRVYIVGYSLPAADWHSRYILRCGFHNQIEGVPRRAGSGRRKPTGRAKVTIVNPDPLAFRRIEALVGWRCTWRSDRISDWLAKESGMSKDPNDPTLNDQHIEQLAERMREARNQRLAGHSGAARKVLKTVRDELSHILAGWDKGR